MCLRTFSDYRPPSFLELKTRLKRLLYGIMDDSFSKEPWLLLLLLARLVRFTSVLLIVLITGLTKLSFRPLGLFQHTSYISSLLALNKQGVISKAIKTK